MESQTKEETEKNCPNKRRERRDILESRGQPVEPGEKNLETSDLRDS